MITTTRRALQLGSLFWAEDRTQYMLIILTVVSVPMTIGYLASRVLYDTAGGAHAISATPLTLAFMTGLVQVGTGMVQDRFTGRMSTLRTLAISKSSYLLSRVGLGIVECMAISGLAWGLVSLLGLSSLPASSLLILLAVAACGGASMSALGVLLAVGARDRSSGWATVSLSGMLLALASPVLYSEAAVPLVLRPLIWLSPYSHLKPQFEAIFAGDPIPWIRTGACVLQAACYGGWAYWKLRW